MIKNVLQLLEITAELFPEKTALVDENRLLSYKSYLNEAKRVGSALVGLHKEKYSRPIIVFVDRRVDTIIAFMGVLYSGNFYVPIDSKTPLERLRGIVNILKPIAVIGFSESENKLILNLNCPKPK